MNPNDPIEATKSGWLSRNDRNYPPQTPTKASNRKNLWTQTIQSRPPKAGGFHENDRDYPLKKFEPTKASNEKNFRTPSDPNEATKQVAAQNDRN